MGTVNLGALADTIHEKIGEIARVEAEKKELEVERRELENKLITAMKAANTDIVRGDAATCSISSTVKPQIADFEKLQMFVLRTKNLQLFERRISAVAYRELKESRKGKDVPGLSEYAYERLNTRSL